MVEKEKLKEFALKEGAVLFGVADISNAKEGFAFDAKVIENLNRAIVIGARLSRAIVNEIKTEPTKIYYYHYRTVNLFLDQLALKVCNSIQSAGLDALPIPASGIIDWQTQKGHVSHKGIGRLAGLGWIGRNNLLVNRQFGSQFRLVTILTDAPLEADSPVEDSCGNCRACIPVCPVGAIKEDKKDYDHMRCYEKLKEFQKKGIVGQYICGVCVKACGGK